MPAFNSHLDFFELLNLIRCGRNTAYELGLTYPKIQMQSSNLVHCCTMTSLHVGLFSKSACFCGLKLNILAYFWKGLFSKVGLFSRKYGTYNNLLTTHMTMYNCFTCNEHKKVYNNVLSELIKENR